MDNVDMLRPNEPAHLPVGFGVKNGGHRQQQLSENRKILQFLVVPEIAHHPVPPRFQQMPLVFNDGILATGKLVEIMNL